MAKEKKQMNAVMMNDLDNLLGRIGILEKFNSGKTRCKFCKEIVTRDSIYSVLPDSGTYHLVDDKMECVSAMLEYIDEKNKKKVQE